MLTPVGVYIYRASTNCMIVAERKIHMPRKANIPMNAAKCHEQLRRLADDYRQREAQFREAGNDRLADKEHEYYEAMIRAMTVLVRTHNI